MTRKSLIVALLSAAIVTTAGNFLLDWRQELRLRSLDASVISTEALQRAEKSVYLVVVDGEASGTAWVVNQECGILATNAHVAAQFDPEGKTKMSVKTPHTGREFEIKSVVLHPGYKAFQDMVNDYGPIRRQRGESMDLVAIPLIPAHDAALLSLSADCAREKAAGLAPALSIATPNELAAIRSGDPVAIVGYPASGAATETVEDSAVLPRSEVGIVRALTSFIPRDVGSKLGDPIEFQQAILHNILASDGTSGSPTFNAEGDVIGMISLVIGEYVGTGERVSLRADAIRELLDGTADSRLADAHKPRWQSQLAAVDSLKAWANAYLTYSMKSSAKREKKGAVVRSFAEFEARFDKWDYSPKISVRAKDGTTRALTPIEGLGMFHRAELMLDPQLNHYVLAASYDYYCSDNLWPMAVALRNADSPKFGKAVIGTNFAALGVRAGQNTNAKYDVLFARRFGCDSEDENRFHYYVFSWEYSPQDGVTDTLSNAISALGRGVARAYRRFHKPFLEERP